MPATALRHPRAPAPRPDVPAKRAEPGLFAEMIRLWLDHQQRVIEMGAFRL